MRRKLSLLLLSALITLSASATTFVVPDDREFIGKASAIVIANVESSRAQENASGDIETLYDIRVERSLKGAIAAARMTIASPGGVVGARYMTVHGSAHFGVGDRVLLFLSRDGDGRWTPTDLTLGKFDYGTTVDGAAVVMRDADDIVGWDRAGNQHRERGRRAEAFEAFVESVVRNKPADASYFIDEPVVIPNQARSGSSRFAIQPDADPSAAATYATHFNLGGGSYSPARWATATMNAGISWRKNASNNATGASDGTGIATIQAALAAWTNDCNSTANLSYAGTTAALKNSNDNANTISFNDPLGSITGTWTGSGTIGVCYTAGFANNQTFAGGSWSSITDADVVWQDGLTGAEAHFAAAMTHELGHGIGFRHSNQHYQTGTATCAPEQECTTTAIMSSSISGAGFGTVLQNYDKNAVAALYPGGGGCCATTAISANPLSVVITAGNSTTLSVLATGTSLTYQWYLGASGVTSAPINGATASSLQVSPASTTTYWVRLTNSCNVTTDSTAATVTVNGPNCAAVGITSHPGSVSITRGASTTLSVGSTGTTRTYQWYIGASGVTTAPVAGATGTSLQVTPSSTTTYWVRVSDACTGTSVNSNAAVVTVKKYVRGDYTGDGLGDAVVFRPSTAIWHFIGLTVGVGAANDTPVQADYDGDRKADHATYRPATGGWVIRQSSTGSNISTTLGGSLDTPAPADYDGDGKADVAVFRKSTGMWTIVQSSNGATRNVQWGGSGGDIPVPSDYDGDGKADIAIFSQGTGGGGGLWYIILSANSATRVVQWGGTGGDIPVPYDFDGDGKDDVAIVSPIDGKWYMILSANNGTRVVQWGGSGGDQPQPSDFDGDGKSDVAIFNPGAGQWYIITSSNGGTTVLNLGQQSDLGATR